MKNPSAHVKHLLVLLTLTVNLSCETQTPVKVEKLTRPPVVTSAVLEASHENVKYETAPEMQELATPRSHPEQKIIRKATLRFQVTDFKKSSDIIHQVIPKYQAQILTAHENRTESTLESDLTVKVLPQQFEPLIAKLAEQSIYLDSKNITSEDVTTEYIDVAARLKTKKAVELRYLDLLQQARTVKDILAIEDQLRQIREEIESSEARMTYLSRQTSYNTIALTYYQKLAATSSPDTDFAVRVRNALQGGWDLLLAFCLGLLQLWPLLLIIPFIVIFLRRFIRNYSSSRAL